MRMAMNRRTFLETALLTTAAGVGGGDVGDTRAERST